MSACVANGLARKKSESTRLEAQGEPHFGVSSQARASRFRPVMCWPFLKKKVVGNCLLHCCLLQTIVTACKTTFFIKKGKRVWTNSTWWGLSWRLRLSLDFLARQKKIVFIWAELNLKFRLDWLTSLFNNLHLCEWEHDIGDKHLAN